MQHIHDKANRDREQARKDYAAMSPTTRSEICDALVLGCFDWRDWFDDKPSAAYLNAFLEAEQLEA